MSFARTILWSLRLNVENEVERLRKHDLNALDSLVPLYQHRLFRYLLRMVGDNSVAEDLFQQTWMRVIERIDTYKEHSEFSVWLFSIAHNLAIDYWRARRPEPLDEDAPENEHFHDHSVDALSAMISSERAVAVATIVETLPPIYREVLTLRFEEGMKIHEIAVVLQQPLPTIKTRLHRALNLLRDRLAPRGVAAQ
jgi:RNA polymerase sigma-70 factor (ECF subfamily)